ncbi:MAG: DUF721 domain-containing protein, partial [Fibrobacteria bacterium]|nr:DUF721 domain-containing protein [Fibrobacteria bacterium]
KCHSPLKISSVLNAVLERVGSLQAIEEKKLRDNWDTLVGSRISEIAVIDSLREHKLYLKVENSVWKMELRFQLPEIIQRINAFAGWKLIKEIILI